MEGQLGQIPEWATYTIGGLGALCGIFFMFLLGIIAKRWDERGGGGAERRSVGTGASTDCSNCPSIRRVEEGLNALNSRIDRILEMRAGG